MCNFMILEYVCQSVEELWKHYTTILIWFEQNEMLCIIVFLSIRLIKWFVDEENPIILAYFESKK